MKIKKTNFVAVLFLIITLGAIFPAQAMDNGDNNRKRKFEELTPSFSESLDDMSELEDITQKISEDIVKKKKEKLMLKAAHLGDWDIVFNCIHKEKLDINARDDEGQTVLFDAILKYEDKIVDQLLAHGAQAAICDNNGHTPLMYALYAYDKDVIRSLIEHGAHVNDVLPLEIAQSDEDSDEEVKNVGNTALIAVAARHYNDLSHVMFLIEHGADHTIKNAAGKTALDTVKKESLGSDLAQFLIYLDCIEDGFKFPRDSRILPLVGNYYKSKILECACRSSFEKMLYLNGVKSQNTKNFYTVVQNMNMGLKKN